MSRIAEHLRVLGLASLAALAFGLVAMGAASADPIGPDCTTCQGSTYQLEYDPTPVATNLTSETFRIILTIDSSGYSGLGTGIDTIAIKVANFILGAALVSAPLGTANWSQTVNVGLNSNGCANGGSGFDCVKVVVAGVVPGVGGVLSWEWDLKVFTGTLLTDPFESSVKARYVDDGRNKVGALVSEPITLQQIPEPTTLLLAGLGLTALAVSGRRVRKD